MRQSFLAATCFFVAILVVPSSIAQYPVQSKDLTAEGVIVAFQKNTRFRVMPYTTGIANFVEFWIVRIDKWPYDGEKVSDQRYMLVEYILYERALTDCEINAKKLRFTLRQRREDEHTDCLDLHPARRSQRAQLSNYELTTQGKGEQIPPLLEKLPCLIAEHGPVVIE